MVLTVDSTPMIRSWKDMAALVAVLALSTMAAAAVAGLGPAARGRRVARDRGGIRAGLAAPRASSGRGAAALDDGKSGFPVPADLPRASADPDVEIRAARGPVTVVADGMILGRLEPGARAASFPLAATGRRTREVELWSEPFRAGDGRLLGTLLAARHDRPDLARRLAGAGDAAGSCPSLRSSPSSRRVWRGPRCGIGPGGRPRHPLVRHGRPCGPRASRIRPTRCAWRAAVRGIVGRPRVRTRRRDALRRRRPRGARRADRGLARPDPRGHVSAHGRERRRCSTPTSSPPWRRATSFRPA